jgi:ribosomal protein L29
MGKARRLVVLWLGLVLAASGGPSFPRSAVAQTDADDVAARHHFLQGRDAFNATEYETALYHFQEAYRLSERGRLQYNIGVTASRLRRDEEALTAFQRYLREVENPSRAQEVRKRIVALETAIAHEKEQRAKALAEAMRYRVVEEAAASEPHDAARERKVPKSAIIGGSVLGAVGVAGVTTMGISLGRSGSCIEEVSGECVSKRAASPWTAVYGAIGIAALAGSATWLVVSSRRAKRERETAWMLGPTGVTVAGTF